MMTLAKGLVMFVFQIYQQMRSRITAVNKNIILIINRISSKSPLMNIMQKMTISLCQSFENNLQYL